MNKTAKDIIIKLIDNNYIDGEEAFILITEVCKERNWYPYYTTSVPSVWNTNENCITDNRYRINGVDTSIGTITTTTKVSDDFCDR